MPMILCFDNPPDEEVELVAGGTISEPPPLWLPAPPWWSPVGLLLSWGWFSEKGSIVLVVLGLDVLVEIGAAAPSAVLPVKVCNVVCVTVELLLEDTGVGAPTSVDEIAGF